jgi:3-hydroxyisobutyrate dehydrogenase-like beta-hydroxyacid dehydrogenase
MALDRPANSNTLAITFIGFGEVGQTFARGLLARGGVALRAHDIRTDPMLANGPASRAAALGVPFGASAREMCAGADIVISAVTASETIAVADAASEFLQPGQFFLDVNSAAPTTKQKAAALVQPKGVRYVECAVMAPVLKPGLAVPILAGGPDAEAAAEIVNALGMDVTPVATEFGRASAMKLCRSIIIKGLEALMVDCAKASAEWQVTDTVFASLAATFPSIDWHALSANMQERVATHGVRRSAEMHEAAEMVAALGFNPELITAIAEAQARGAASARQMKEQKAQ